MWVSQWQDLLSRHLLICIVLSAAKNKYHIKSSTILTAGTFLSGQVQEVLDISNIWEAVSMEIERMPDVLNPPVIAAYWAVT